MSAGPSSAGRFVDESPKVYTTGTDRSRSPADTLAAVEPLFVRLGITRIANVTGLDRIGIPVHMVVRPNSRSLAVSQGKGIDPIASKVSGVMESIELHHAERYQPAARIARYLDLFDDVTIPPPVDPEGLPISLDSRYTPFAPLPWTEAVDLLSGGSVLVPLELVYGDCTTPELPGIGCFVRSSNGLASGNTFSEAVLAALCEVVERDADSLWRQRADGDRSKCRVDLSTVDDPACRALLERYDKAGVHVVAWDITSDVGLAAFRVVIVDGESDELLRPMPGAYGAGCHPRREVALARALTEAAQSRLTTISGTRDDLSREMYRTTQHADAIEANRQLVAEPNPASYAAVPTIEHDTVGADVLDLLDRLAAVGVSAVAVSSLAPEDAPYKVVKVVVAGLEGPVESFAYRPGPRARAIAGEGVPG